MFARVTLIGDTIPNALLVPERAVQQLLGKSFVMVVGANNKAEARTITLGDKIGSYYVVKDGLDASDTVVVEGLTTLQEGGDLAVTMVTPDDMGFTLEGDPLTLMRAHRRPRSKEEIRWQNFSFTDRSLRLLSP